MLTLRAHALIAFALFIAILLFAGLGNVLAASGLIKNGAALQTAMKIFFLALTVALAFSMIPVIVKGVLAAQVAFGNGNLALVKTAIEHEVAIILTLWSFMLFGFAVALPFAIRQRFLQ